MAREIPEMVATSTPGAIRAVLGGKEYNVQPLAVRAEREWKQAADTQLDAILNLLEGVPSQEISSTADLMPVMRAMKHTLLYATDQILDLVCLYSPEVNTDREHIEEHAYTPEIIALFIDIVGVVFPLAQLRPALRGLAPLLTSRR